MKKILILFAIFLLAFSTIVIAQEDTVLREKQNERGLDSDGEIKQAKTQDPMNNRITKRKVNDKIIEAKKEVAKTKENYLEVRNKHTQQKLKLLNLKEGYKRCLNSEDEECKLKIRETKRNVKGYLTHSADLILSYLEKLKTKTEASTDLSEEDVNDILEKINTQITEVESAKATLEGINEDSTREEIKEITITIKEAYKKAKFHIYKAKLRHLGATLDKLITKAEIFGERVKEKAEELNSEELNSLLEDYNSKVQSSREQYSLAKGKWQEAETPSELNNLVRETHQYLKESNNHLKEARRTLRAMIKELKKENKEISLEVEEVEE